MLAIAGAVGASEFVRHEHVSQFTENAALLFTACHGPTIGVLSEFRNEASFSFKKSPPLFRTGTGDSRRTESSFPSSAIF